MEYGQKHRQGDIGCQKAGELKNSSPPSISDHLTSGANSALINDLDTQVQQQLLLAVAGIHTTSPSVIHRLYDLAAHCEYVAELR